MQGNINQRRKHSRLSVRSSTCFSVTLEGNVLRRTMAPSKVPHSATTANQIAIYRSNTRQHQAVNKENYERRMGISSPKHRIIIVSSNRGTEGEIVNFESENSISGNALMRQNNSIQPHHNEQEHSHHKLLRTGKKVLLVARKQNQMSCRGMGRMASNHIESTSIQSLPKTGGSFQSTQKNHASQNTKRLLLRRQEATNTCFGGSRKGRGFEENTSPRQANNGEYVHNISSIDNRARREKNHKCIAALVCDYEDRSKNRRVGVCASVDTTKRERVFARVVRKRL